MVRALFLVLIILIMGIMYKVSTRDIEKCGKLGGSYVHGRCLAVKEIKL